jgi:hypothetical protein
METDMHLTCTTTHHRHGRGLAAMAVLLAAGAGLAMLLWNALLPHLLALPAITYLQSLGLMVLARLLLGGGLRPHRPHAAAACRTHPAVRTDPAGGAAS